MGPVSATTTIDAPREQVFDVICDLSRRPAFTRHFQAEFRLERVDPVGVGASARFRLAHSGAWLDTVIVEAVRPHLVRERGTGGRFNRIPAFTVWELAEGPSPATSEVTVTFWTEPTVFVDKLHEPFGRAGKLRREWNRALRQLRDLVESGGPVEPVGVAGGDRLPGVVA